MKQNENYLKKYCAICFLGMLMSFPLLITAQCDATIRNFIYLGNYENSVYYLSSSPAQPMQAQTQALAIGGNLVSINTIDENSFLQSKIDEMVYIGLNDAAAEGSLIWENGDLLNYTNYDFCAFCNENNFENDFAIIHPWNGGWSFTNKWSQRNYIVEITCDETGNEDPNMNECTSTIDGFQFLGDYENSKYFLSNNSFRPEDAQTLAAQNRGYLIMIDNADENDFLSEKFDEMVYIGLSDAADEGNLQWLGAGNSTYRNIDMNCGFCQVNDAENDYVVIHPWNSKWSFTNQWSQRKFIMEVPCEDVGGEITSLNYTNCPTNRTIQLTDGQSNAFVNWTPPTLNNMCGAGLSSNAIVSGPTNGSSLTEGFYTVRYRGTNNCGDEANCTFSITVEGHDEGGSSSINFLNCPVDRSIQLAAGETTAFVNWTPPSVSSTCAAGGLSLGLLSGPNNNSSLSAGNYIVRYRGVNNCGDEAICEFTISIISASNPSSISISCPDNLSFSLAQGNSEALIEYPLPSVTSNCTQGGTSLTRISGPENNSLVVAGNYTIRYRAINSCDDVATCTFDIEVREESAPSSISINCPNNITFFAAAGTNTALVNWQIPTITNTCNQIGTTIAKTSGPDNNSLLPEGTYVVTYSATNNCGDIDFCSFSVIIQPDSGAGGDNIDYTANDQVIPYTGKFRPGTNVGYNPPWTDEEMANLAAGNNQLGIKGIGARTIRPGLYDVITAVYGYDFRLETYQHYASLGLEDLTMIVGFPADWHRDQTDYCGNGFNSAMFRNLYADIWDDGADGTPYNDDNYYAAYIYEVVSRYGPYVKFWEIWNEPGFDLTGNRGWRQPGDQAGNWWDNDPDPCEYILRAPIEHYVRTLRISWEIIKTLQPDDYVTVAGVGFTSFLDAILRNTDDPNTGGALTAEYPLKGGAYFDVMGFHSYPDIDGSVYDYNFTTGQRVWKRHSDAAAAGITFTKNNYQDILDNYGYTGNVFPKKEWIITEINVPRKAFRADAMSGGEEMQVNYIIKAVATAMKNDIHQMHVYNLGDKTTEGEAVTEFDLYGLHKRLTGTNAYTQVRNKEAIAYKSVADFVYGSRYDGNRTAQMNLSNNFDGAAFRLDNGNYKYIIWAKTTQDQSEFANGNYSFPSNFGYNQVYKREWNFTDTDQVLATSSSNIVLTGRPIFITETPSMDQFQSRLSDDRLNLKINAILPNPAVDEIKLVLESHKSENYFIKIYDAQGSLINERETFIQRGFSEERFDVSQYVHGMYFVLIQDSNMRSTKVKFIKSEK